MKLEGKESEAEFEGRIVDSRVCAATQGSYFGQLLNEKEVRAIGDGENIVSEINGESND